jgi:hypothetical protein
VVDKAGVGRGHLTGLPAAACATFSCAAAAAALKRLEDPAGQRRMLRRTRWLEHGARRIARGVRSIPEKVPVLTRCLPRRDLEEAPRGSGQMNVLPFGRRWAPEMKSAKKDRLFGAVYVRSAMPARTRQRAGSV